MHRVLGTRPANSDKKVKEKKPKQGIFGIWRYFTSRTKEIKSEDLATDDIIIAVIGPTGTGKSAFIEAATGLKGIVGHSLETCTTTISFFKLSFPELVDSDICFVDTPGFDDTYTSDFVVFKRLSDWLLSTYKRKIRLSSLLYFHRISDVRMSGNLERTLRYCKELCGESEFDRVILTTTMWNEVDHETGARREEELINNYWKSMIDRGSSVQRFLNNRDSAFEILSPVFDAVNKTNEIFLQNELKDLERRLSRTAKGRDKFDAIQNLVSRHQKALKTIRGELRGLGSDQGVRGTMEEQRKVSKELQQIIGEIQRMKVPIGKRIQNIARELDWKRIPGANTG